MCSCAQGLGELVQSVGPAGDQHHLITTARELPREFLADARRRPRDNGGPVVTRRWKHLSGRRLGRLASRRFAVVAQRESPPQRTDDQSDHIHQRAAAGHG